MMNETLAEVPLTANSVHFYRDLEGFSDFRQISQKKNFKPVPKDWILILTDVEGSTEAIRNGRYRDVNTLGAASIATVQSSFDPFEEIPFVFGGDGATFLIHANALEKVMQNLEDLQAMAKSNFGLSLRIAFVPVADIYKEGQQLEVAKFFVGERKPTALIRGGGLTWAEGFVKMFPRKYNLRVRTSKEMAEVKGLSCRWEAIPSRNGSILSILVQARGQDSNELYAKLILEMLEIFGGNFERANPIQSQSLKYKGLIECIVNEAKLHRRILSVDFLKRCLEITLCVFLFKWRLSTPKVFRNYFKQISEHSDFQKFDDVLRLTLDATPEEERALETYLRQRQEQREIYYGIHRSSHAIMTCLVKSIRPGEHIHFVDGNDGGYAEAAKKLKDHAQAS